MADPQDSEGLEKEEIKEFLPDAYLLDYIEDILRLKSAFNNPVDTGGTYFTSRHEPNQAFNQAQLASTLGSPVNSNLLGLLDFKSNFNEIFVKLAGRSDMKQFGELTGLNIAGLHPRIKLYRIDQSEGGVKKKREFVFNYGTSMNPSTDIFESSQFKGGAGIKSLSYTLAGTNPAEAERAIDVSITFAFQSVNDFIGFTSGGKSGLQQLIESRNYSTGLSTRLNNQQPVADLTDPVDRFGQDETVTPTFNYLSLIERPSSVPNEYNARNFEIVAEIGYSVNQSTEVVPEQLRKRIEGMNLNLVLNLINHELTFTEEGSLELKVNYYGSLQQYMNDPKTDYFSNEFENDQKFKQKKKEVDDLQAQVKDLSDQIRKKCVKQNELESKKETLKTNLEILKTKKEEQKEINNNVRSNIYSSFIGKLYEKTLLYSFTIPKESVTAWTKYINDPETNPDKPVFPITVIGIPTKPNDDFKETAAEAAKEEPSKIDSKIEDMRNKKIEPDKEYAMYYFYFGDLLQNITQVYEVGNTNNRIILGDIEFEDPRNLGTFFKFNLGEIPINLQLFQSWFLEKIVKPKKLSYRLDNMIRDLINGLLRPALDTEVIFTNADKKIDVKVDLSFTNFSIQTDKNKEPINDKNLIDYYGVIENNISNFSTTKDNTPHYYNYFVIYSKVAFCSLKGDQIEDEKNGIMHLYVGRNVGPVTSIKFKRIDQPYIKEAKATREGFTPLSSLRDIYNVDVGMIGNHFFYPGMNVFIHPPVSFGNPVDKNKSLANIMGIGGYYSIIKVSSVIDAGGKYETSLDCYWQSFGDGCGDLTTKCK
jgi:hypothetical protein